jgi:hypothetical protein
VGGFRQRVPPTLGAEAMRISFSNEATAQAAVAVLEQYGYRAIPNGAAVETECPPLLAVPAVGNAIGLHQIAKVHIVDPPREPRRHSMSAQA